MRLFREIDPSEVSGTIVIALATNEESLLNWTQFAPTEPEVKEMMVELATGSNFIINCHGGEFTELMHPYVICRMIGDEVQDALAQRMARQFGVGIVSVSTYRGEPKLEPGAPRPAWWLWPKKSLGDELRIPEITPEVGEVGSRDDTIMYGGIVNVLRDLGILAGETIEQPEPRVIQDRFWLTADEQGIFFPQVEIGSEVKSGQALGIVRDYFGETLQEVTAPADSTVMNMNVGMPVKKGGFLLWLGTF
jgi:predicted deacylase